MTSRRGKAREFAESSKMALATMLEFGPGYKRIFCAIKLSAKLVFLGNGILVIPFFDIGKWLFVSTLKSHLNNVLRVMFTLCDRRIMRENCYCPCPKKCVYFSYIPQGNLKLGYGLAYSLTKCPN